MATIKIKRVKVSKIGNSYFFRIPKQYIDNETIEPDKDYNINIL